MKPDLTQTDDLVRNLKDRHGDKFDQLRNEARIFSKFIKALHGFRIVDPDPLLFIEHVASGEGDWSGERGHPILFLPREKWVNNKTLED